MPVEIIALALTLVVHVMGAGVLIWALLDGEKVDWRALWPRDDDGRGGSGPDGLDDYDPRGGGTVLGPPLADAAPSRVRLREPGRIAEGHPQPARRPEHVPPSRPRVPAGS